MFEGLTEGDHPKCPAPFEGEPRAAFSPGKPDVRGCLQKEKCRNQAPPQRQVPCELVGGYLGRQRQSITRNLSGLEGWENQADQTKPNHPSVQGPLEDTRGQLENPWLVGAKRKPTKQAAILGNHQKREHHTHLPSPDPAFHQGPLPPQSPAGVPVPRCDARSGEGAEKCVLETNGPGAQIGGLFCGFVWCQYIHIVLLFVFLFLFAEYDGPLFGLVERETTRKTIALQINQRKPKAWSSKA